MTGRRPGQRLRSWASVVLGAISASLVLIMMLADEYGLPVWARLLALAVVLTLVVAYSVLHQEADRRDAVARWARDEQAAALRRQDRWHP